MTNDQPDPDFEPGEVPTSPEVEALRSAILARVCHHFIPAGVPATLIQPYAEQLVADIERSLAKFAAGQIKHGGNILERDLLQDLAQEIIDAAEYIRCMKLQRKSIQVVVVS